MQTCRVEARQCRVECWSPQAPFVISQACLVASNDVRLLQPCQSGLPSPSFFAPFSSDHPPRGQRPDGRGRSPLQLHLHALLLMQRGGATSLTLGGGGRGEPLEEPGKKVSRTKRQNANCTLMEKNVRHARSHRAVRRTPADAPLKLLTAGEIPGSSAAGAASPATTPHQPRERVSVIPIARVKVLLLNLRTSERP